MKTGLSYVMVACAVLLSSAAQADSMRCGKKLIKTGDTTSRVLANCGEPLQRELLGVEKTKKRDKTEFGSVTETKETKVEKWTYNLGAGTLLRTLTFRDGVLTNIDTGARI